MSTKINYIQIKEQKIPLIIRSYKNSNKIKIYFKGNVLNISKPYRFKLSDLMKVLEDSEEEIYDKYIKITSKENTKIKKWVTGEKIYYQGIEYVIRRENDKPNITIKIEEKNKEIKINVPKNIADKELIKENIDKAIKKIFKNNTEILLQQRIPYWSEITGIKYNSYKVRDATTRYGSCVSVNKTLNFSSRLIMLPLDKIDAIIVHELCHIIHNNHSTEFYNLVKKYISNYDEIHKWLKQNNDIIIF